MAKIDKAVYKVLFDCLRLKAADSFLVLVDQTTRELGQLFFKRASQKIKTCAILEIGPRSPRFKDPPAAIVNMLKQMSAILALTSNSLVHSNAFKHVCHNGSRVICLNPLTENVLARTLNADFDFIDKKSRRLADLFSIGKKIQLTTGAGTNLLIPIARHHGIANTGIVSEPGSLCVLPSGEARITPDRRETKGVLVVDGSIPSIGILEEPIVMHIQKGYAYQITGGKQVAILRNILKPFGRSSRNIAEFGIGTNNRAILTGQSIEDEKVLGTAHIALGSPDYEGGSLKRNLHLDVILKNPTVSIDGHPVVENGNLVV